MAELSPLRRRMIEDMTVRNCRRRPSDPTSTPLRSSAVILVTRQIASDWKTYAPSRSSWWRKAFRGRR